MKLNVFLWIKAAISAVFGFVFLLVPDFGMSLFGTTCEPAGALMTRYFGAALLGVGLVCMLTARSSPSQLQKDVLLSLLVFDSIGLVLALVGQVLDIFNALGWVIVAIWLLLVLGLGYFRFLQPPEMEMSARQQ